MLIPHQNFPTKHSVVHSGSLSRTLSCIVHGQRRGPRNGGGLQSWGALESANVQRIETFAMELKGVPWALACPFGNNSVGSLLGEEVGAPSQTPSILSNRALSLKLVMRWQCWRPGWVDGMLRSSMLGASLVADLATEVAAYNMAQAQNSA